MAWSVLQSASATNSGSGNVSVTLGSNVTSGSKLIVLVGVSCSNTSYIVSGVADGASNAWTLLASKVSADFSAHQGLYALDAPSGDVGTKPTITATIGTNFGASILVQEVSGLLTGNTTGMLDGSAVANTGTASPATGGSYSSTASNEYLVTGFSDQGNSLTLTTPSGYTADAHNVTGNSMCDTALFYKNTSNGSESASITLSGSATWDTIFGAFQLAASGGNAPAGVATSAAVAPQPGISGQVTSVDKPVNVNSGTGSVTGQWSAGSYREAGHLLVAVVSAGASTSAAAITEGSGTWSQQVQEGNSSTAHTRCAVFTKTAAGGDAAPTFTSTEAGTAGGMDCMLFELIGANTTSPLDTSGVYGSGSSTATLSSSTFTVTTSAAPSAAGGFAVAVFAQERAAGNLTFTDSGTGWTKLLNGNGASARNQTAVLVQQNPSTGSTLNDHGQFSTDSTAYGAAIVAVFPVGSPSTSATAGVATALAVAPQTAFRYAPAAVAAAAGVATAGIVTRYITGVHQDNTLGGWFTDQAGQPRPWIAAETWGIIVNAGAWSSGDWQTEMTNFLASRAAQGFTVVMTDPIWSESTNTESSGGNMWDGTTPLAGGSTDPSTAALNSTFWTRVDYLVSTAASYGITIAPTLWNNNNAGLGTSWTTTQWTAWANKIATRYLSSPNIIWLFGNDAWPSGPDSIWNAILTGLGNAGDSRPKGAWYEAEYTSRYETDNATEAAWGTAHSDFNFCYTYNAGYWITEYAYLEVADESAANLIPVIWGDGYFSQETSGASYSSTYSRAMRQEWWWCLASGARGVVGEAENVYAWSVSSSVTAVTGDWFFANNTNNIVSAVTGLTGWHQLIPDTGNALVTAGRGSRVSGYTSGGGGGQYEPAFTNSYVAASRTPDSGSGSSLALLYLPNHTTITIDQTKMVSGYTATWVDPVSGATSSATAGSTYNSTAKGTNSQGDPDWVLVLAAAPSSASPTAGVPAAAGAAVAPSVAVTVHAGVATSAGAVTAPVAAVAVHAAVPVALAADPGATVTTSSSGTGNAAVAVSSGVAATAVPAAGVPAGVPAGLSAAVAPLPAVTVTPAAAAAAGVVTAPSTAVTVAAGVAVSLAVAPAATVSTSSSTSANAGVAAAAAVAVAPVPAAGVNAAPGAALAVAPAATVSTSSSTSADAGVAASAGVAPAPVAATGADAGVPAASGTAPAPSTAVTVTAGVAASAGTANAATVNTSSQQNAQAGVAASAGVANQAALTATANAAPAAALAVAPAQAGTPGRTVTAAVAAAAGAAVAPSVLRAVNPVAGVAAATSHAVVPLIALTANANAAAAAALGLPPSAGTRNATSAPAVTAMRTSAPAVTAGRTSAAAVTAKATSAPAVSGG